MIHCISDLTQDDFLDYFWIQRKASEEFCVRLMAKLKMVASKNILQIRVLTEAIRSSNTENTNIHPSVTV